MQDTLDKALSIVGYAMAIFISICIIGAVVFFAGCAVQSAVMPPKYLGSWHSQVMNPNPLPSSPYTGMYVVSFFKENKMTFGESNTEEWIWRNGNCQYTEDGGIIKPDITFKRELGSFKYQDGDDVLIQTIQSDNGTTIQRTYTRTNI